MIADSSSTNVNQTGGRKNIILKSDNLPSQHAILTTKTLQIEESKMGRKWTVFVADSYDGTDKRDSDSG